MLLTRAAIPSDVHHVAALLEALITDQFARYPEAYPRLEPHATALAWVTAWHHRCAGGDPNAYVWLACDRAPLGLLAGEVWTRPAGKPAGVFFAEWFYVVPEARHRGVGIALERALVTVCRARGLSHVEARSTAGDTQWLDRGWLPTSIQVMRPLEGLAVDLALAETRRAVA